MASDKRTMQGDPLAMSMYAVGILPQPTGTKQDWFADDATGGGTLKEIRSWWDQLNRNRPRYGYHPKASKSWLIVKEAAAEEAKRLFSGTGVQITTEGERLLGAAIGDNDFEEKFTETIISPSSNKYPDWLR